MIDKRKTTINYLIKKLKDDYNLLSLIKAFSSSPTQSLVIAIFGVGIGVTSLCVSWRDAWIYKFPVPWISNGPEKRNSSDIVTVAGLQNLGNNCFLNVVLQALSSTSYFLPFLQNVVASDDRVAMEHAERMPLTLSLTSVLEELFSVRDERAVLNPRRVMLAMGLYVSSFNLTRQQDAAEAFLHVMSSLEEEISDCYVMHGGSLADITTFPSRFLESNREGQNEFVRWQKHFFGPFDGTIGNMLSCTGCSTMLSMDFEIFRCLPLSPVLDGSADIVNGCTLMDCLKHFTAVEVVEDYRCSRCWHIAALKYLNFKAEKDEEKIELLRHCVNLDSCGCRNLFSQEEITWTGFSSALKKMRIARCPKILCIHLKRVLMNGHGEQIKLQGHVSFPLLLDLSPFVEGVAIVEQDTSHKVLVKQGMRHKPTFPQLLSLNFQKERQMLLDLYGIGSHHLSMEAMSRNKLRESICESSELSSIETGDCNNNKVMENETVDSDIFHSKSFSASKVKYIKKVGDRGSSSSTKSCMYRLSSVVEHYGSSGSGHYAVYRVAASSEGSSGAIRRQWFYASDRAVSSVSEEAVLAAEASLLFYEKIEQ